MKDNELEKIFAAMKLEEPSLQQMQKWQQSLATEKRNYRQAIRKLWWQWLLAGSIGFASAAIIFSPSKDLGTTATHQENDFENATYEYVYTK